MLRYSCTKFAGYMEPLNAIARRLSSSDKRNLLRQLSLFCITGGLGFAVNAFLLHLLKGTYGIALAQVFAFPVAVTITWVLNRYFTFCYKGKVSLNEIGMYLIGNIAGWAVINIIFFVLISWWTAFKFHPIVALGFGAAGGAFVNFLVLKFWAFREQKV